MKMDKKSLPKNQLELTIELSVDEVRPYLEKAAARLAESHNIPGFRPGKAPYDIISAKLGEMNIYEAAIDEIVSKTLWQTLHDLSTESDAKEVEILGQPQITLDKVVPNNPFVYKAVVSLVPEVEVCDLKKIKVTKKEVKIEDKKINDVLNQLAKMRAKESLTNEAAKTGDKVMIDFNVSVDNVPIEHGQGKNHPVVIGENTMIPGFEDNLIGMKKDESKTFELSFPAEYHAKNLAGKKASFAVKCLDVYKIETSEINDEFAKSLHMENLAKLKEQITENLKGEAQEKETQRQELELLEQLVEHSKVGELADNLVMAEAHQLVHEIEHTLESQGLKWADYLTHLKKTEEELIKDNKPQAERRLKTELLTRAIAKNEKLAVTKEELNAEVESLLKAYQGNAEAEANIKNVAYRNHLGRMLLNLKVIEYLKKTVIAE